MRSKTPINLWIVLAGLLLVGMGQLLSAQDIPPPLSLDDPKGLRLGPGVPRTVDTNGNVINIDMNFTTKAYRHAAAELMLAEVNQVARELQLPEPIPITGSNIVGVNVNSFGFGYTHKTIGSVMTSNYLYCVVQDFKFNSVTLLDCDRVCRSYRDQMLPLSQIKTNEAYQLAKQFMSDVSMDVKGLNRDCTPHVAISPMANDITRLGEIPKKQFAPLYCIWWTSKENDAEGFGDVVYIELYLPSKKLIQLDVRDPKYILRKPLVFTNLASLFPGKATITYFTNYPPPRTVFF